MSKDKNSLALVWVILVVVVLTIIGAAIVSRSVHERSLRQRYDGSTRAFWLAEAGISRALQELKGNYTTAPASPKWSQDLGLGTYSVDLGPIYGPDDWRNATSTGIFGTIQRIIRAVLAIPPGFWDNALYSAEDVDKQGGAGNIDGNVSYNGNFTSTPAGWAAGIPSSDTAENPLPELAFSALKAMSIDQGLFCDAACVAGGGPLGGAYPTSFWNDPPVNSIPNIIYIEGSDINFQHLAGPMTYYGGFYVVAGGYDVALDGKVTVDGVVYTQGEVTFNGGGDTVNVNGGVFSGEDTIINGGIDLGYNQTYMHTLRDMNIGNIPPEIIYWEDLQNPYPL
jgi:hypothetical protein